MSPSHMPTVPEDRVPQEEHSHILHRPGSGEVRLCRFLHRAGRRRSPEAISHASAISHSRTSPISTCVIHIKFLLSFYYPRRLPRPLAQPKGRKGKVMNPIP